MAIAQVQDVAFRPAIGGSTTKSLTVTGLTAGSALRMWLTFSGTSSQISSMSGGSVTWSQLATIADTGGGRTLELWGADNCAGGGTTIDVVVANTYLQIEGNFSEWSGVDTTPVPDPAPSTNTATSASAQSTSVTPTAGKEVLLLSAGEWIGNTWPASPDAGFTALTRHGSSSNEIGFAYKIVASASGSYQCTWTLPVGYRPWGTIIAGWDAAGGGGGGSNRRRRLLFSRAA